MNSSEQIVNQFETAFPSEMEDAQSFAVGYLSLMFALIAVAAAISYLYKYLSD